MEYIVKSCSMFVLNYEFCHIALKYKFSITKSDYMRSTYIKMILCTIYIFSIGAQVGMELHGVYVYHIVEWPPWKGWGFWLRPLGGCSPWDPSRWHLSVVNMAKVEAFKLKAYSGVDWIGVSERLRNYEKIPIFKLSIFELSKPLRKVRGSCMVTPPNSPPNFCGVWQGL